MQHEVLTQRAAEPCQQVMMLSTMRTGSSSFFDSTFWWTGEAMIASTEKLLQTGRLCLIFVSHKTNISPNKIFLSPSEAIHYLKQKLTYNLVARKQ